MSTRAAILGPTASGKSEVAMAIAAANGAEIVSVDSMQVYRGMDIGTAKPSPADRRRVAHHLIDIADPDVEFSVAAFQEAGRAVLQSASAPLLIVGGSGLHYRALIDPLVFPPTDEEVRAEIERKGDQEAVAELLDIDPDAGNVIDIENPRRVTRALEIHRLTGETPSQRLGEGSAIRTYEPSDVIALGLDPGQDELRSRIAARVDAMLGAGLVAEVQGLAPRLGRTASNAVGYRQVLDHLAGDVDDVRGAIVDATTALARRQRTWFGRDPRIRWIPWDDDPSIRTERVIAELEEAGWSS